ncbi:hypothetical protein PG996_014156 [Apiospora saccharicola]|uniref:GPI inositol-deacylase winged helix domain-containing protein n=1 Tax=Apiospora saccharicola TaxID=335842 RepID=A0ABR1THM8_9PEZI
MKQLFKAKKKSQAISPPPQPGDSSSQEFPLRPPHRSSTDPYARLTNDTSTLQSHRSDISDFHGQLFAHERPLSHRQKRSQDRRENPLGLTVLYEPQSPVERLVDIVLIHGLGGTSLRTWCHNRDLQYLWPQQWLPNEPGFEHARIITYGYNAHFSTKKEHTSLAIGDFANDLLFRMKYEELGGQRLGEVPIVFAVHSMGGLVFKKAFIHGLLNNDFRDMMGMVTSVLFLATPHRGADLAETLNKVLTSSIFGHSPKDYVAELARRSPTINELNESFRHHASKLQVFSFYETLSTAIGPMSAMILEKDSAVLGYPGEMPQPLTANHHEVCKFKGTDDPNYAAVVGALRSAISAAIAQTPDTGTEEDLKTIKEALGLSGPPEDDMALARSVRKEGTCEYFLNSRDVLVFSRPHPTISQAILRARKRIDITDVDISNNQGDVRLAVLEDIEYLPSDDGFKRETTEEITRRSQGNFLWASLVAGQVAHCHRQDQVRRILETTPDGMDNLYDRMLLAVSSLESREDQSLARIFLSWAMYARTPLTVEELSEIYRRELASLIELKHTVYHVCGQFVVIDTNNKVTLVHQSAHEYLRKHSELPFSLDSKQTHEDLLGKCLVTLCDKDLRRKLASIKIPQFLQYAATSWAFHLEHCSNQSDRILNGLVHFFNGTFVLSWIQYLAMSGHLAGLPVASRKLIGYIAKVRKWDSNRPPMLHRLSDLALLESWSIDLLKITAKFGRKLSEDPTMIFKCIPALSPSSSAINQKFGNSSSMTLSVNGVTNEEWDDCLVRVPGSGGKALRLASSPRLLAVAAETPRGSFSLWDSSLYRERQTFNIKQRITEIVFNSSGSLVACCGANRTLIWRVDNCTVVAEAKNPFRERAVGLKFDDHQTLYMVTDIRHVYSLSVHDSETPATWVKLSSDLLAEKDLAPGVWLGTPQSVSFNSDCTAIAIAYRSFAPTVWAVEPPRVVARLRTRTSSSTGLTESYTGGEARVVWHPSDTQVLGIHGEAFKWTPSDDVYEAANGDTGSIPNAIECSPNGLVFITGDAEGTIRIYEVSSMVLIYKLSSEDGINRISFSSDNLRFYDLRGSHCNVWEPNCLARIADASTEKFDDGASTTDSFWSDTDDTRSTSISFPASESYTQSKPRVMALAHTAKNQLVAFSNTDGSMELFEQRNNMSCELEKSVFGIFEKLEWSPQGRYLAQSQSYGAVTVLKTDNTPGSEARVGTEKVYHEDKSPDARGNTRQLLFAPTEELLLVYGETETQVVGVSLGKIEATRRTPSDEFAVWANHPSSPHHLICLTMSAVTVYNWSLQEEHIVLISIPTSYPWHNSISADEILRSYCRGKLLVRTTDKEKSGRRRGFAVIATDDIPIRDDTEMPQSKQIMLVHVAQAVRDSIEYPVGLLHDGRIVFLDESMWGSQYLHEL